jgi:hypothetical protein
LARLESRLMMNMPVVMRYGWLKPLAADFTGERHRNHQAGAYQIAGSVTL